MKPLQIYKPQTAKIVSWEKIEDLYIDLISYGLQLESMLALVQYIRSNKLDDRLFAYISMAKLIVTIYNPAEADRESLHIEYNTHTERWHFEYRSKPFEPFEAERFYNKEDGIKKFCRYIDLLKW